MIGGGEVEAGAAGLERDQHHRRPVGGLEARRPRRRGRGSCRRGARTAMLGLRRGAARSDRAARSTARTPAPCARRRPRSPSASSSASTFDDVGALLPGHQRRVAGGLAQAQQRLERLACTLAAARCRAARRPPCASRRGPRRRRRARCSSSSTCSTASVRGGSSGATSCLSRRSTNGRMRWRSAAAAPGAPVGDRARVAVRRSRARPPSRPRLVKCIRLHSSSSRFSTGVPVSASRNAAVQRVRGARDLAVGVLDRLRLVEDHGVPARAPPAPSRRGAGARRW